jgi:hypothetical protein
MSIFSRKTKIDQKASEHAAFHTAIFEEPCTLLAQLRKERREKIDSANKLDVHIAELDAEITYIERHPGCDRVLQHFLAEHEQRPKES